LLSGECANCKRTHRIFKGSDDPLSSKELARWIGGELRRPVRASDVFLKFVETEKRIPTHLASGLGFSR
jgi:hypothetical protein